MSDIELPPLPYDSIAELFIKFANAAIAPYKARIAQLELHATAMNEQARVSMRQMLDLTSRAEKAEAERDKFKEEAELWEETYRNTLRILDEEVRPERDKLRELLQFVAEESAPWTKTLMSTEWGKLCRAALGKEAMTNELIELADRATAYLAHGGLFNPEMAEHGAVRNLILDCRDMLRKMADLQAELADQEKWASEYARRASDLIDAVDKLYFAAHWTPDRECDAVALWTAVRDAAGIEPGQTAERLGPPRESAPACKGIPRPGCNYMAACDTVCNKCGKVHSAHLLAAPVPAITAEQKPVARETGKVAVCGNKADPFVADGDEYTLTAGWDWKPAVRVTYLLDAAPIAAITAEQKAEVLRLADECRFAGEACHQFILTDYESNGWTDEEIQERREQVYSTMGQRRKALIAYLDKIGVQ